MSGPVYGGARHLSIVWAVTLAILTLVEWRQLDSDPLNREILSPFIERQVSIRPGQPGVAVDGIDDFPVVADVDTSKTSIEVEFHFNGPLFLLCFFGPVAVFYGVALLLQRLRGK